MPAPSLKHNIKYTMPSKGSMMLIVAFTTFIFIQCLSSGASKQETSMEEETASTPKTKDEQLFQVKQELAKPDPNYDKLNAQSQELLNTYGFSGSSHQTSDGQADSSWWVVYVPGHELTVKVPSEDTPYRIAYDELTIEFGNYPTQIVYSFQPAGKRRPIRVTAGFQNCFEHEISIDLSDLNDGHFNGCGDLTESHNNHSY